MPENVWQKLLRRIGRDTSPAASSTQRFLTYLDTTQFRYFGHKTRFRVQDYRRHVRLDSLFRDFHGLNASDNPGPAPLLDLGKSFLEVACEMEQCRG